jgi:hypothetical protein
MFHKSGCVSSLRQLVHVLKGNLPIVYRIRKLKAVTKAQQWVEQPLLLIMMMMMIIIIIISLLNVRLMLKYGDLVTVSTVELTASHTRFLFVSMNATSRGRVVVRR